MAKVDGEDLSLLGTVTIGDDAHSLAMVQSTNRLWVTCRASDQIAIINPTTMEVVGNIEIEGTNIHPMGIAVSPYNGRVYVTLDGTGSVGIFDPGEEELISTVHVGGGPDSIIFSPSGDKAYVVDYEERAIYVIDAMRDTLIDTLDFTGPTIQDAVASPDGSLIYLANMYQNQIEVIRTRDNTILAPITTSLYPRGIAISPDGRYLFLGHYTAVDAYVDMIRLSDSRVVSTAPIPSNPRCIGVSSDGQRIFVTEHNEDALYAYDVSGEVLSPVGHVDLNTVPGQYASPVGLLVQEVHYIESPMLMMERPPRPADLLPDPNPLRYVDTLPIKTKPWPGFVSKEPLKTSPTMIPIVG